MEKVCIIWLSAPGTTMHTLTYRPEGTVRTYDRDAIDPRVGPYVLADTVERVRQQLVAGKTVAVPISLAKAFAPGWVFA